MPVFKCGQILVNLSRNIITVMKIKTSWSHMPNWYTVLIHWLCTYYTCNVISWRCLQLTCKLKKHFQIFKSRKKKKSTKLPTHHWIILDWTEGSISALPNALRHRSNAPSVLKHQVYQFRFQILVCLAVYLKQSICWCLKPHMASNKVACVNTLNRYLEKKL